MKLPAAILLIITALAASAFGPMPQQPSTVSVKIVDINEDGIVAAQLTPSPLALIAPDGTVEVGETLHCTLGDQKLDCDGVTLKPLGFMVRGASPELRVERRP